jgi:hypothetical protein
MAQQHPGGGGYKVEAGVPATAADHDSVSGYIIFALHRFCHVISFCSLMVHHLFVSGLVIAWLHLIWRAARRFGDSDNRAFFGLWKHLFMLPEGEQ